MIGGFIMFEKIQINDLCFKPFELIGSDWMLITSGDESKHNTMTASWGGIGILWNNPVATTYIRPSRYTKEFIDQSGYLTMSFFDDEFKPALQLCGTKSGRDIDKDEQTGLTPKKFGNSIAYEQAKLVLVCKVQYVQRLNPDCFLDKKIIDSSYPNKDYHFMYISKILEAYSKK